MKYSTEKNRQQPFSKLCLFSKLQEPAEPVDPDGHQGGQQQGDGVHQPAGQLRRPGHCQHRHRLPALRGGLRYLQEV